MSEVEKIVKKKKKRSSSKRSKSKISHKSKIRKPRTGYGSTIVTDEEIQKIMISDGSKDTHDIDFKGRMYSTGSISMTNDSVSDTKRMSRNSIFNSKAKLDVIEENSFEANGSGVRVRAAKKKDTFVNNEREFNKKSLKLRKLQSTASLIDYFTDDETDLLKRKRLRDDYFYHEHDVNFSFLQYMESMFVHIIFFSLLGPFINIYTCFTKKNKHYMCNLLFGRVNHQSTYLQLMSWAVAMWSVYIYLTQDTMMIDYNTMYVFIISIVLRSSVIAGKYATYPRNLMRKVREVHLTKKELEAELMLGGWFAQDSNTIAVEIDSTMKRMEIDNTLFKIAFFAPPSKKTQRKIIEIYCSQKNACMVKKSKRCEKDMMYYDSKLIFEFLIRKYIELKAKNSKLFIVSFAITISLLYGFGGGIIRVLFGQTFHGESALVIALFYVSTLFNIMLNIGIYLFFGVGIVDLDRKIFMVRQLGQIISPKKLNNYPEKKYLPTINILDQLTLNTFVELRKLIIDYGRKYFFRHEIFMPVLFIIGLINLVMALAIVFFDFSNGSQEAKVEFIKLQVFMGGNFVACYLMLFNLLFKAASINQEFDEHIAILKKNKQLYKDLLFFKEFYFAEKMTSGTQVYTYDAKSLVGQKSTSYVHLKLAREVMDILGNKLEDNIDSYLRNLIFVNDACVEELEDEQRFNSLKLLGFTITSTSVNNLIVVFVSVIITAYEILI